MEPPLSLDGDSLAAAKGHGYVTSSTLTQQELEHIVGALSPMWFAPARNATKRTTSRCSATPPAALCRCPSGRTGSGQQRWLPYLFGVTGSGTSTRLLKPAPVVLERWFPECGNRPSICPAFVSYAG
ncbi:hypothetical protein MTO96_026809 [Rhipicephalus appendiculatus]